MFRKLSRKSLLLFAVLALAACAQLQQDIGQCEGGVEDLSTLATAAPQNPC